MTEVGGPKFCELALKVSTLNDADFVDVILLYLRILEQVQLDVHRL